MAAYDFIVVGAGSAGCAVAGRLAAESSATVLLIEAGGSDRRLAVRAPLAGLRQFGTSLDWGYETDPEPDCADRRIPLHTGRVLGGTSAMNAMVWVKGSNLDYDGWQLPGWSWDDVAPVFARIEQGPMRISRTPYPDELSERFVAAARAAGVRADDDVSGPELDGVTLAPVTIHNGQRWSTPRGYLGQHKNMTVLTKAEVHRVIIRNGRAVGIEYRRGGRVRQAFADQQVVVSAGAYATPVAVVGHRSGGPSARRRDHPACRQSPCRPRPDRSPARVGGLFSRSRLRRPVGRLKPKVVTAVAVRSTGQVRQQRRGSGRPYPVDGRPPGV